MSAINLSAKFGKKDQGRNGLNAIAEELADKPLERRYVVGIVECIRTTVDHTHDDEETSAVRFVHVEAALTDKETQTLRRVLEGRYKARNGGQLGDLGEQELPFNDGHGAADSALPDPDDEG